MDEQLMSWATTRPEVLAFSLIHRLSAQCASIFFQLESVIRGCNFYFTCCVSQDWQEGGKSEVYLWGNGRYGQLAGMGTNLMMPTLAPSLLQTQQVATFSRRTQLFVVDCYFLLIFLCLCGCFHCQSGCVWAVLFLPGPVQWDSTGCRRRAIWETGPGEF